MEHFENMTKARQDKRQIQEMAAIEACLSEPWVEITEDEYQEKLEILPPEKWENCRGWSVFRMCEYLIGNITGHYIKTIGRNTRFFTAHRRTSQKYTELCSELWNQLKGE